VLVKLIDKRAQEILESRIRLGLSPVELSHSEAGSSVTRSTAGRVSIFMLQNTASVLGDLTEYYSDEGSSEDDEEDADLSRIESSGR